MSSSVRVIRRLATLLPDHGGKTQALSMRRFDSGTLSGNPSLEETTRKPRSRLTLAVATVLVAVMIVLALVLVLPSFLPPHASSLTPEQQVCTTTDVGPGFAVNQTYSLTPLPGDLWLRGVGVSFHDTSGRNVTLA